MPIHLVPPPAGGRQLRPESKAAVEGVRDCYRRLQRQLDLELAQAESNYAKCLSLVQALREMRAFFPSLQEETEDDE
jgi:hypothetical protein